VQIVGVVGDIKSSSLIDGLAEPYVYLALPQRTMSAAPFTARASIVARRRASAPVAAEIAGIVRELNPSLVVVRSETLVDSVALGLTPQRLLAALTGSLGLVGLLLASVGLYGVIAFTVTLRRREFGIRTALGAQRFGIIWLVLKHGMWLVGVGGVIGLAVSVGAGEVLSVFLYGLPAIHVPTLLGAALLFLLIGATACYIPARHALGIDLLRALRDD
jgi:ABC-type antimicrobial peptide transport system permease subunit